MKPSDRRAQLSFGSTSYTDNEINAPCLIFIHGSSFCKDVFVDQLECGILNYFRIIALDLPGHGLSDNVFDPKAVYTIEGYAAAVLELMTNLGIDKALIVGWSFGGHIAIDLLARDDRVVAAMAIGAPPCGVDDFDRAFTMADSGNSFAENWSDADVLNHIRTKYSKIRAAPPAIVEACRRADPISRQIVFQNFLSGAVPDQRFIAETCGKPLAVVCGADDREINILYLASIEYMNLWRNSVFAFETCGHAPFIDNTDGFNDLLFNFACDVFRVSPVFARAACAINTPASYVGIERTVRLAAMDCVVSLSPLEWELYDLILGRSEDGLDQALNQLGKRLDQDPGLPPAAIIRSLLISKVTFRIPGPGQTPLEQDRKMEARLSKTPPTMVVVATPD